MEVLKYIVEDKTIAELLGRQNFINEESAVLELIKNAYDAKASFVNLDFFEGSIIITDDGIGMDSQDIKRHWMHIGKSEKKYEVIDRDHHKRVMAGSMGIGRFALARLGERVCLYSRKKDSIAVRWETDWESSELNDDDSWNSIGTKIVINKLRKKWGLKQVKTLYDFLCKTYNDNVMRITINHPELFDNVEPYFTEPELGINCLSYITLNYNAKLNELSTKVVSDEFLDEAKTYCGNINYKEFYSELNVIEELNDSQESEADGNEMHQLLTDIGDFNAKFLFAIKPTKLDIEKFLYKYSDLQKMPPKGVILYRNAFSISSYEGKRDWLEFGKRSRKSPAAATHPTGSWRVRENQISGKVEIDKKRNAVLQDLSNRQGLNENIYYKLFVQIILLGIKEFERYRQEIIRAINAKNDVEEIQTQTPIIDRIIKDSKSIIELTSSEAKQLSSELKTYKKENKNARKEKEDVENRYKYDVRILNVLSTIGLKASSIAHEMKNDKNTVEENVENIIKALEKYGMWKELTSPEKTKYAYQNVPQLLNSSAKVNEKIVTFMNVMLSEVEKRKFKKSWQSISDIIYRIKKNWEKDYGRLKILIDMEEDICFNISEDVIQVIFDNLILNSYQQNEKTSHNICISIKIKEEGDYLQFDYSDNGKGLDVKYKNNPRKILEVHETTRKNGHGLGMWIVNNTLVMTGGRILDIIGEKGFSISFLLGGKYSG